MFSYSKENLKNICKTGKELGLMISVVYIASLIVLLISHFLHSITHWTIFLKLIDGGVFGLRISILGGFIVLFLMILSFLVTELFRSTHK